ncbi:ABC transporter ATP-binding protein [Pseudomonas sp. R3.Fl]|uniref:ABC transporter ATP-binding protein n=1 Tax=Pseudomonas sp. R3.Fl TaxID=2928708 RepID=UPI00201E1312|nr:ABC transporter ATP-binding protein [Pseudomonas sp. R3.Fl]MCL6690570.1 ABC transporter ATP-binding protein [Pseudomonas sp. R3.Fl]
MPSNSAIIVSGVSKCYNIYDSPQDRLKQMILRGRRKLYREFWALRDVSFEVPRGETVGIVGRNGSGKSTLLQIIAGTLTPTSGSVTTSGRVAALLELGSGFNADFTGRENVYLNAALLGLTQEEIDDRFDSIASFADIGYFIDQPVKTYSSGMLVRLAFAVQAQIDPEILIVDEALAVGDAKFQARCFDRLKKLKDSGTSILLVTHSSEQVVTHCSSAVLLDSGSVVTQGKPREVINNYLDLLFGREKLDISEPTATALPPDRGEATVEPTYSQVDTANDVFSSRQLYNPYEYRWGDGSAIITDFALISDGAEYPTLVRNGSEVILKVGVKILSPLVRPILGVTIKTKDGVTLSGSNSELLQCEETKSEYATGSTFVATVRFDCTLGEGDFFISLGVATRNGEDIVPHDRRYDSIHFAVGTDSRFFGLTNLNMKMSIE